MGDEVRPTWRLAWGLWWRMSLITLGIAVIIWAILFVMGTTITDILMWLPW